MSIDEEMLGSLKLEDFDMRFHASVKLKLLRGRLGRWLIECVTHLFSKRLRSQSVSSSLHSVRSGMFLSINFYIKKPSHVKREN
jgi:hypothetical protein